MSSDLLHIVRSDILRSCSLPTGCRVLVGVSGGVDSVVLLHVLQALHYDCIAAHCNFRLRGTASVRDEQFVRQMCHDMGIRLVSTAFDTSSYARTHALSIEMAARQLRYEWFEQQRQALGADSIAVGHHQDDQAETLLLNLTRGTGLRGLCGMSFRRDNVVRPLLGVTRRQIADYAMQHGLSHVEDHTNRDDHFARNRMRNQVLPQLEQVNPAAKRNLNRTQQHLQGYLRLIDRLMDDLRARLCTEDGQRLLISIDQLMQTADPVTVLHELLSGYGLNDSQSRQIVQAMHSQPGRQFATPMATVTVDRQHLIVTPLMAAGAMPQIDLQILPMQAPLHYPEPTAPYAFFDADKLGTGLYLRHWEAGDRFVPFGMQGSRKLSDFFIDQKISRDRKPLIWLLCTADGRIAWVVGHRTSQLFRVDTHTTRVARVEVR